MIEKMYQNSPENWESQYHSCINGVKGSRNLEKEVFLGMEFETNSRAMKNLRTGEKTQRRPVRTKYTKKINRHFFQERSMIYSFIKKN